MTPTSATPGEPFVVEPPLARGSSAPDVPTQAAPADSPTVAAIVVTFNRKLDAQAIVVDIAAQRDGSTGPQRPPASIHLIIVDNASSDGTSEHLARTFHPTVILDNASTRGDRPQFTVPKAAVRHDTSTALPTGLASITLIRNAHNLGGCGGFNTGLACVRDRLDQPNRPVDFAWLVDDDARLPTTTLASLLRTASGDASIGLVGSRAVDVRDRRTTIESTIYYDTRTGRMADTPSPSHPLRQSHDRWIGQVGAPKGDREFVGVRDVDIASACSLLARWEDVRSVGLWDDRFFIYCDDADWCLRFKRAGKRVVCDLDAVVYHTPWFEKLTPSRLYYAQRNAIWVTRKAATGAALRLVLARWFGVLLRDAAVAMLHRRLFHSRIVLRTINDSISGRGGRLDDTGPTPADTAQALISSLGPARHFAAVCCRPAHADALRQVAALVDAASPPAAPIRWTVLRRNDLPGLDRPIIEGSSEHVYSHRARSKVRRQLSLLFDPPDAVIVFDQLCDVPLLRGRWNVHVDTRSVARAQAERSSIRAIAALAVRWLGSAMRAMPHALLATTDTTSTPEPPRREAPARPRSGTPHAPTPHTHTEQAPTIAR